MHHGQNYTNASSAGVWFGVTDSQLSVLHHPLAPENSPEFRTGSSGVGCLQQEGKIAKV